MAKILTSVARATFALASISTVLYAADPPVRPSGEKPSRVSPFVEDEEEAAARAKQQQKQSAPPAGAPQAKSNFQPKFRAPPVRQVQHLEPIDAVEPSEPEANEPQRLDDVEAPLASASASARELIDEAFERSKTAESEEDYAAVIDLCRRASSAGLPKNFVEYTRQLMSWSHNRRGEARAQAGNDAEALTDFEAAVELNKTSWRALHNRGVSYAAQHRIREALRDFDRTIELKEDYPNAYFNRAELRYHQGDFANAIVDYTHALQVGAPDAVFFNSRGHAYYRLEKFGDALRDYGEAIKVDPNCAAALINRGDAYSDLGKYGEAAKDYREAVRVAPKMSRAYQSAAWLMATCPDSHYRNDELAVDAAKKAIELGGDRDFRCWETLAAAQASAGMFMPAKDSQEQAIALAPKDQFVTSEKRMSLYQRELAYRDRPRVEFTAPDASEYPVRQASAIQREASPPVAPPRSQNTPPAGIMPRNQNVPPAAAPPGNQNSQPPAARKADQPRGLLAPGNRR